MATLVDYKDTRRPCYVDEHKALFHCWAQVSSVIGPSMLKGGHSGGTVTDVVAVVEYENGKVATVLPKRVRFIDTDFYNFAFCELEDLENENSKN